MSDLDQGQTPSTPISVLSKAERARLAREALLGKTIAGRYVLRSLLGHGGMGAVYEAEQVNIGKKVAIKFVDPEFVTDEQILTRFAREARAMSTIESPHIVSIFDAGTEEGRPYLVMELLRGEDLGQRLRRTSRVPLAESLHIIAMVLKGLSKAHAAGIVHRDLKPDNIFLVKHDAEIFAKIVDFGVSKIERPRNRTSPLALTGRGTVLGTPFYMSPEQAQAIPDLDGRADLFSVGTILFECLAGRPPFTGETYEQIILAICMRDAPELASLDATIPTNVSRFVAKALARDRAQRFASADEMLAALHELSPEEKRRVPADPPPANKTMVAGGSAAAVAAAATAAGADTLSVAPNLTAPTPTSVKPFKGASTQIAGSAADATAQATPVGAQQASALLTQPVSGSMPASGPTSGSKPVSKPVSTAPQVVVSPMARSDVDVVPSVVPRRSGSAVIATAIVATLLGVVATFAIIAVLAKKDPVAAPPPASASTSTSASTASPIAAPSPDKSAAVLLPLPSAEPATSATSATSAAPSPLPTPVRAGPAPGPGAGPAPKPSPLPVAAPRPKSSGSGKSLDINRDLP